MSGRKKKDKKEETSINSDSESEQSNSSESESSSSESESDKQDDKKYKKAKLKDIENTGSNYTEMELKQHIYKIPDTYAGSDKSIKRYDFLAHAKKGNVEIKKGKIYTPKALTHIIVELYNNVSDAKMKEDYVHTKGYKCGNVSINVDKHSFRIKNYGVCIPIEKDSKGEWILKKIFGILLTSSNYEGIRFAGGRNGYGAKLANIFSEKFYATTYDHHKNKICKVKWSNNMDKCEESDVEKAKHSDSFVEIYCEPDFKRFERKGFDETDIALFRRYAIDLACITGLEVKFNDEEYKIDQFEDYIKMYYPKNKMFTFVASGTKLIKDEKYDVLMRVGVVDTKDKGSIVPFTNCVLNSDGGRHVDEAERIVCPYILGQIKELIKNKDSKYIRLNKKDVLNHITIFVDLRMPNPHFNGQSKAKMEEKVPKLKLEEELDVDLKKWDIVKMMKEIIETKLAKKALAEGKGAGKVKLLRCSKAIKEGTKHTELSLIEGDSAKGYWETMLRWLGGREYEGSKIMKGKPINSYTGNLLKIIKNAEIKELWGMLGLFDGIDLGKNKDLEKLKYHKIKLYFDPDPDGIHIIALTIAFIWKFIPSMFDEDRVYVNIPPIATYHDKKTDKIKRFYSDEQIEQWISKPENKNKKPRYLKGMGSFNEEEIFNETQNPRGFYLTRNKKVKNDRELVFGKTKADERKRIISGYDDKFFDPTTDHMSIHDFMLEYLPRYFKATLSRAIPRSDFMKDSQARLIYSMLQKAAGYSPSSISSFAGQVKNDTNYHHGDASLSQALMHLCADYIGGIGFRLVVGVGRTGTRIEMGKDAAAPRYPTFVVPQHLHDLFPRSSRVLWEMEYSEGSASMPKNLLPIIPILTHSSGIACGFSYKMPNYKVQDIVRYIIDMIKGKQPKKLFPYYEGFKGKLEIVQKDVRNDKELKKLSNEKNEDNDNSDKDTDGFENNDILDDVFSDSEDDDDEKSDEEEDKEEKKKHKKKDKKQESEESEDKSDSDEKEEDDDEKDLNKQLLKVFDYFTMDPTIIKKNIIPTSLLTYGKYEKIGDRDVHISELPIGVASKTYNAWLAKLKEEGKIKGFKYDCIMDSIDIDIYGCTFKRSMRNLKLITSISLNQLIFLDEKLHPKHYGSIEALMNDFYYKRLEYYKQEKDYYCKDKVEEIRTVENEIKFMKAIINKKIVMGDYEDRDDENFVAICKKNDVNSELLKKTIDVFRLTKKQLKKSESELEDLKSEYKDMVEQKPEEIWLKHLDKFLNSYEKFEEKNIESRAKMLKKETEINRKKKNGGKKK